MLALPSAWRLLYTSFVYFGAARHHGPVTVVVNDSYFSISSQLQHSFASYWLDWKLAVKFQ